MKRLLEIFENSVLAAGARPRPQSTSLSLYGLSLYGLSLYGLSLYGLSLYGVSLYDLSLTVYRFAIAIAMSPEVAQMNPFWSPCQSLVDSPSVPFGLPINPSRIPYPTPFGPTILLFWKSMFMYLGCKRPCMGRRHLGGLGA